MPLSSNSLLNCPIKLSAFADSFSVVPCAFSSSRLKLLKIWLTLSAACTLVCEEDLTPEVEDSKDENSEFRDDKSVSVLANASVEEA